MYKFKFFDETSTCVKERISNDLEWLKELGDSLLIEAWDEPENISDSIKYTIEQDGEIIVTEFAK